MLFNNIHCINFPYNTTIADHARNSLDHILELAPYNSVGQAEIENRDLRYWCKLKIASRFGNFMGIAHARSPAAAIERARRRLLVELSRWRRQRVFRPALADA